MLSTLRERGFFHLVSANALAQGIAFVAGLVLTKLLTPEDLGATRIIQSYFTVLVVLGGLGLGSSVLKFAAEDRPLEEKQGIWAGAVRRAFFAGSVSSVLLAVGAVTLGISPHPDVSFAMAVYAIGIPFSIAGDLSVQFLQSQGRAKAVAGRTLANRLLTAVLILSGTAMFGLMGWTVAGIVGWIATFAIMASAAGWRALRMPPVWPEGMATFSRYALLANVIYAVNQNVDFMILDRLAVDRREIGIYAFAALFLIAATQLVGAMQAVMIPYLASRRTEIAWVHKTTLHGQGLFLAGGIVAAFLIQGAVWATIQIAYPEFQAAMGYSAVLMLRFVFASAGAVCGAAVFALGQIRLNVLAVGLGLAAGSISGVLLTLQYGVIGAAWGQVIGSAVTCGGQWFGFRQTMRRPPGSKEEDVIAPPAG